MFSDTQKEVIAAFGTAVSGFDRFEAAGDGKAAETALAFRNAFIEESGRFCSLINSEEFAHISMMHKDPYMWAEIIFIAASDPSFRRMRDTLYGMLAQGRKVLVFSDADPSQITAFRNPGGDAIKSVYKPESAQTGIDLASGNIGNLFICRLDPGQTVDSEDAGDAAAMIAGAIAAGELTAMLAAKESADAYDSLQGKESEPGIPSPHDPGRLRDISYYNKFYFQDSFHAQCADVDPLTEEQISRSLKGLKALTDDAEALSNAARISCGLHGSGKNGSVLKTTEHILLCGCGDSYIAAMAAEAAFRHYLPDVKTEAVEGIELSRHYDLSKTGRDAAAVFISYSGSSLRTLEALKKCRLNGICTITVTANSTSPLAQECDILYNTDTPAGDNHAGLRTYFSNVLSLYMLAAEMAQLRTGEPLTAPLCKAVKAFHDSIFGTDCFRKMDEEAFRTALRLRDHRFFEVVGDGLSYGSAAFIQAKIAELSGLPSEFVTQEEYAYLRIYRADLGETAVIKVQSEDSAGADIPGDPASPAVWNTRIPAPPEGWDFLLPLYDWLPGSLFAGFQHVVIGEPMFRGGFDPDIFNPAYFSPVEIIS